MVQPKGVTDQPVIGLEPIYLGKLLTTYPELDQSYLGKQGQHDRRCGRWGHAFIAWELLIMCTQIQTDLPLDHIVDEQANDREHR